MLSVPYHGLAKEGGTMQAGCDFSHPACMLGEL